MDSIKVINESRYFVISSCLLVGQIPVLSMFCFNRLFVFDAVCSGTVGGQLFGLPACRRTLHVPDD
jgi:hypothetical protein